MVRAILEGRKTQTRRMVTPQPTLIDARGGGKCWHLKTRTGFINSADERAFIPGMINHSGGADLSPVCPYGQRGDRLWVRETWACEDAGIDGKRVIWQADRAAARVRPYTPVWDVFYLASNYAPSRWRPSIHMPRWASRLTLEVTEVRAQRLQEISDEDARAEGVQPAPFCKAGRPPGMEHVEAFEDLWDGINGKRCAWSTNPWVWAISFKVVKP
jgi:hypothetical protein